MRMMQYSDVNNLVDVRNIYGAERGPTVGERGSGYTPYTRGSYGSTTGAGGVSMGYAGRGRVTNSGNGPGFGLTGPVVGNGVLGRPLTWWFVLVVMLVGLMWTAQRFGTAGEDFRSVRLSVYNIVVITLAAMIGFGAFKVIFSRFQVPGLSDYIVAV